MKFQVSRLPFLRMIGILITPTADGKMDSLLRICARDGTVHLACNNEEAACEAMVETEGTCFLRHDKLRRLLQSYHSDPLHKKRIQIEVNSDGICVGRTILPRSGWEISLFLDPDLAPARLDFQPAKSSQTRDEQSLMPWGENVPARETSSSFGPGGRNRPE